MKQILKVLHITNHPGTILNANHVAKYINNHVNSYLDIIINTISWSYSYYINESRSNEIFKLFQDEIESYNILLFSDTPMYARPFLQNIDKHTCFIIQYVANRYDWGIWNFEDNAFYKLYSNMSRHNRVRFIADNNYDQYYAQQKGNIQFKFDTSVRLTPYVSDTLIILNNENRCKFFIQNRGSNINSYCQILNNLNIKYDVFDSHHRYRDKEHICEYLGIFLLPYQVNVQALWENLGYGIIHFIPSRRFLKELFKTGWYYWEELNKGEHLLEKSIELCEWYAKDLQHCFEYFDSWEELQIKYQDLVSTDEYPVWYIEKKQKILNTVLDNNIININKWFILFYDYLKLRPTIVTMFYNIRKKDGDESNYHRKQETFYALAEQFILKLKIPLMICMDPDDNELYNFVNKTRINNGLDNITYCYREKFENTYFYKYVDQIENNRKDYIIYNGNPRHETSRYITLNNNKFYFIDKAIELNKFGSDKFIWLDMGINHVAKDPFEIVNWQFKIPDKIKQLCINPFLENDEPKDLFHNIFHHTAGGLFTGNKIYLSKYIELFKLKLEQILNEGWYQIDEAIMTIVQKENRDLFEFYYGDYEGIIKNYNEPEYSMNLIMKNIEKTLIFNKSNETFKIMVYLVPYFLRECNQYSGHFYQFIKYNIICNYYHNNFMLLDSVIDLINKKLVMNDNNMKILLENNKNNLNFYNNKDKIKYLI